MADILPQPRRQAGDVVVARQIDLDAVRVSGRCSSDFRNRFQLFLNAPGKPDCRAVCRKRQSNSFADAAAGSSHQSDLIPKCRHASAFAAGLAGLVAVGRRRSLECANRRQVAKLSVASIYARATVHR